MSAKKDSGAAAAGSAAAAAARLAPTKDLGIGQEDDFARFSLQSPSFIELALHNADAGCGRSGGQILLHSHQNYIFLKQIRQPSRLPGDDDHTIALLTHGVDLLDHTPQLAAPARAGVEGTAHG